MITSIKKTYYRTGASLSVGLIAATMTQEAHAEEAGNNFSSIAKNVGTSIEEIPGLITALAYLFGTLLAVLGVMKIKDHVENPGQTPLKDGAIRLLIGGALFALPILMESMFNTVGTGDAVEAASLHKAGFNLED